MSNGVKVVYSELEPMRVELDSVITEFDQAGNRRGDLAGAIGSPYSLSQLRDASNDFESRWNDRRKRLMGNCEAVRDHVISVIEGFQQFDEDAAAQTDDEG